MSTIKYNYTKFLIFILKIFILIWSFPIISFIIKFIMKLGVLTGHNLRLLIESIC